MLRCSTAGLSAPRRFRRRHGSSRCRRVFGLRRRPRRTQGPAPARWCESLLRPRFHRFGQIENFAFVGGRRNRRSRRSSFGIGVSIAGRWRWRRWWRRALAGWRGRTLRRRRSSAIVISDNSPDGGKDFLHRRLLRLCRLRHSNIPNTAGAAHSRSRTRRRITCAAFSRRDTRDYGMSRSKAIVTRRRFPQRQSTTSL